MTVRAAGIYSVTVRLHFQCIDDQDRIVSNGWALTLNSFPQGERNPMGMAPAHILASTLVPVPSEYELQRQPYGTLFWVGLLRPGDELRVESERPKPRLYQGVAEDYGSFVKMTKLAIG